MGNSPACNQASRNLYDKLIQRPELKGIVEFGVHEGYYYFHVKFVSSLNNFEDMDGNIVTITGINIMYSSLTTGNKGPEMGDPTIPQTIEITLMSDDSLCYIDKIDYGDARRFISEDEIVEEIIRIAKFREANM